MARSGYAAVGVVAVVALVALALHVPLPAAAHVADWIEIARVTGGADFGRSVAIEATPLTLLVGDPNQNRLRIHDWVNDAWQVAATITPSDQGSGSRFGSAVAIDGDLAVVGAYLGTSPGLGTTGAAYVLARGDGSWSIETRLEPAGLAAGDRFGQSVDIDGETIVVGAPGDDSSRGAAYVFVRSGGVWTLQAQLTASDGAANRHFGVVAVAGDRAMIGAPKEPNTDGRDNCAAYAFERSGATWTETQKLRSGHAVEGRAFGASVAMWGDEAIVGDPADPAFPNDGLPGRVLVWRHGATGWSKESTFTGTRPEDDYGAAVAYDGLRLAIGQPRGVPGGFRTFIFERSGTGWITDAQVRASESNSGMGLDLAADGGFVAIAEKNAGLVRTYYERPGSYPKQWTIPACLDGFADVTLDGRQSHIHNGGPLTFEWTSSEVALQNTDSWEPYGTFPLGSTPVSLTVGDGFLSTTTTIDVTVVDAQRPALRFLRPLDAFYDHDQVAAAPTPLPIIRGPITLQAEALDACHLVRVEFGVGAWRATDSEAPFEAVYTPTAPGLVTLRVWAYDDVGFSERSVTALVTP